ncbi:MAG: hypothetical protein M0C28_19560 [Candidatus Moduliflexus flocculans]|nr:hypothetical protein [Candidatus Moduliflexus flocculans]
MEREMLSVEKTQFGQIQPFTGRKRAAETLFDELRQVFVVVTESPRAVDSADPHGRVGYALDAKGNAAADGKSFLFHAGAVIE